MVLTVERIDGGRQPIAWLGRWTLACAVTWCLANICSSASSADSSSRPPNILVIVADDLGYGELGCYGGQLATPNLDALASSGVRFTQGYVTAPFCAASRAALLTGRYQTRFGFEFNPIGPQNSEPQFGLPVSEKTLADELRNLGYATALVGKWHLGGTARFHPQRRGFDEFFGFLHEGHYYVPVPWKGHITWLRRKQTPDGKSTRWASPDGRIHWSTHMGNHEPDYDADNPILRSSQPVDLRGNLTDAFTTETESFIERHRHQPFFICLAYNAVHSPMQADETYWNRYPHIEDPQRRIFAAMLSQLDDGVGRVLAKLDATGLRENTMVFFLSDNGGPTRELTSSNGPLRGEKGSLFEGGIRVPMIASWPGQIPTGKEEDRMVSSLDIFATASACARGEKRRPKERRSSPPASVDGVDWMPFFSGANTDPIHRELYWRVGSNIALRKGEWKLLRPREPRAAWQLYHLAQDISESTNLAAEQPDRLAEMIDSLNAIDSQMIAPLWNQR